MSAKTNAIEAAKKALPNNVIIATVPNLTEPEANPIGGLKPTPQIEPTEAEKTKAEALRTQLIIDDNLSEIEQLYKLYKQYNTTEFTLEKLNTFTHRIEDEDNGYGTSTIKITDAKGEKFETQNPRLVEALVKCLITILSDKKAELGGKIKKISINA